MSFPDADTGFAVGNAEGTNLATIARTTDGGQTWEGITPPSLPGGYTLFGVHFLDANIGTVVGSDGVILRTKDGGENWTEQMHNGTSHFEDVFFTDAMNGIAVAHDGEIWGTTDGGDRWDPRPSGTSEWLTNVTFPSAEVGYVVGFNGTILHSEPFRVTTCNST